MIPKNNLHDNTHYVGTSPHTSTARWDSRRECFWYVSVGFEFPTPVQLRHSEDGGSFTPVAAVYGSANQNTFTQWGN